MAAIIQTFRLDEVSPRKATSVRGRGVNGQDSPPLLSALYPINTGLPGLNIRLGYDQIGDGFYSPRHHHNFDQFRYMLKGDMNIGKNTDLLEGECGYFPEGTFYGPLSQKGDATLLVLQSPGPNGAYRMLRSEQDAALDALLAAGGTFENGVYKRKLSDGRTVNKDGFEAIWEQHMGQPVTYANNRYPAVVIMKPKGYGWIPDRGRPGVEIKHLGTFNEYRTSIALWRLAPGAVIRSETLAAPEMRFVISGDTAYDGRELGPNSVYYVPDGQATQPLQSHSGAELLVISIPMYVSAVWEQARSQMAMAV